MTGTLHGRTIRDTNGAALADVIVAGPPWQSSMGDVRLSFRARSSSGQTFDGTLFSDGRTFMRAVRS